MHAVEGRGPRRQDVQLLRDVGLLASAWSRLNFFRVRHTYKSDAHRTKMNIHLPERMMRTTMIIGAGIATALLAIPVLISLSSTGVLGCAPSKRILSPAEQARSEEQFEAHRKAVQARNIRELDRLLARTRLFSPDRTKVRELRDEAAKLRDAGQLSDADRPLLAAFKTLGHPELFVFVARPNC
jgi:hypothetical protein